jgi:hypothetical protein
VGVIVPASPVIGVTLGRSSNVRVYPLLAFQRQRACRLGVRDGQSGTLTVIQRFGGALNLNIHFHTLVLDGVFTTSGPEGVRFYPTPPPTDAEVARLLTTIRARILRRLRRQGLGPDAEGSRPDPVVEESPVLAGLSTASVQGRVALGPRVAAAWFRNVSRCSRMTAWSTVCSASRGR